jgi:biopolymer transport protein ExbD
MAGHLSGSSLITKVNVVPIIDVALVLVIILLVTAPMITVSDLPVNLPQARSRGAEDERNLSITLGPDGQLAIDRDTVGSRDFQQVLRDRLARPENANVLVVVRADTGAPYTRVGQVLEDARAAGATRLAIATRQAPRQIDASRPPLPSPPSTAPAAGVGR